MLLVGSLGLLPQAEIRRLSEMIEVGQRADLRLTVKAQLRSTMPQVEYRVGRPRGSKVSDVQSEAPHSADNGRIWWPCSFLKIAWGQSIPWHVSKPSSD